MKNRSREISEKYNRGEVFLFPKRRGRNKYQKLG